MIKVKWALGYLGFSVLAASSCGGTAPPTGTTSGNDQGGGGSSNETGGMGGSGAMGQGGNGGIEAVGGQGGVAGMGQGGTGGLGQGGMGGMGQGGMGQGGMGQGGIGQGGTGQGGMGGMPSACGNGVLDMTEACDDGNQVAGDGCSATCQYDSICGNGKKEPGEACDDGGMVAGDGCGATCAIEMGTTCGAAIDLNNAMLVTRDGETTTYDGTTMGSTVVNFSNPSCSIGTTGVPTVLHRYRTQPTLSRLIVKTMPIAGPLFDSVLWMFSDCSKPTMEMACNDDSGSGKHARLRSPILPPSTDATFVLAGHNMSDVGSYQLVLTEQSIVPLPNPGTCMSSSSVIDGHYLVSTSGLSTQQGTCTGAGAPEAVMRVSLGQSSDLRVTVTPENASLDVGVYLRAAPCGSGMELGCAEAGSSGQTETLDLRNLSAGNYFLYVDGFTPTDAGLVQVDIDTKPVVGVGMPCDPKARENRCIDTASCVGMAPTATCKAHTILFAETFDLGLGGMTVIDTFADGNGWGYCDPVLGCTQDNTTESLSGEGFVLIKDKSNASLDKEILRTPAVSTAGFSKVFVEFHHDFDHWDYATDQARVEVSKDGTTWTTLATYTLDTLGRVVLDASAVAANATVAARFVYDDQTAAGDSFAEEWRIDDVRIVGIP